VLVPHLHGRGSTPLNPATDTALMLPGDPRRAALCRDGQGNVQPQAVAVFRSRPVRSAAFLISAPRQRNSCETKGWEPARLCDSPPLAGPFLNLRAAELAARTLRDSQDHRFVVLMRQDLADEIERRRPCSRCALPPGPSKEGSAAQWGIVLIQAMRRPTPHRIVWGISFRLGQSRSDRLSCSRVSLRAFRELKQANSVRNL
jgi:hypothetical protein